MTTVHWVPTKEIEDHARSEDCECKPKVSLETDYVTQEARKYVNHNPLYKKPVCPWEYELAPIPKFSATSLRYWSILPGVNEATAEIVE